MISSLLIIGVSLVLFVYWFRYTCLLILSAKTTKDYAGEVAAANQLSFPEVQEQVKDASSDRLDHLRQSLNRDYAVITYLLRHANEFEAVGTSIEQRMLRVDYHLMKVWYHLTRRISVERARQALEEMSTVVAYFANSMGEHRAHAAAAA